MRKEGAIHELRNILSDGVTQIVEADPAAFLATSNRVVDNLEVAFVEHQKKLDQLLKKRQKFFGIDVTKCVVVGGISIVAAACPPPFSVIGTAITTVVGAPSVIDVVGQYKGLKNEKKTLQGSPIGMLFQHSRG